MKDSNSAELVVDDRLWSVCKFWGQERLSQPYHYLIEFESDEMLNIQAYLNLAAQLIIRDAFGSARLVTGYVHTFAKQQSLGSARYRYSIDMYASLHKMMNSRGLANFANTNIWQVSQALLIPLGLTPVQLVCDNEQVLPLHKLLQQNGDEDDLNFFNRLWAEHGFHYRCETDCEGLELVKFDRTVPSQLELTLEFMPRASHEALYGNFEGVDVFRHEYQLDDDNAWRSNYYGESNCLKLRLNHVVRVQPILPMHAATMDATGRIGALEHTYYQIVEPSNVQGVYCNRFTLHSLDAPSPPLLIESQASGLFQLARDVLPLNTVDIQGIEPHLANLEEQTVSCYGLSPHGGIPNSQGQAIGMGFSRLANTRVLFTSYSHKSGLMPVRLGTLAHRGNPGANVELKADFQCMTGHGNGIVLDQHQQRSLQLSTQNRMSSLELIKDDAMNSIDFTSSADLKLHSQQDITGHYTSDVSWQVGHEFIEVHKDYHQMDVEGNIDLHSDHNLSLTTEASQDYLSQSELTIKQAKQLQFNVKETSKLEAKNADLAVSSKLAYIKAMAEQGLKLSTDLEGSVSITALNGQAGLIIDASGNIELFGNSVQFNTKIIKCLGVCHYESETPHIKSNPGCDIPEWSVSREAIASSDARLCFVDDFESIESQLQGFETLPKLAYGIYDAELKLVKGAGLDDLIDLREVEPDKITLDTKSDFD